MSHKEKEAKENSNSSHFKSPVNLLSGPLLPCHGDLESLFGVDLVVGVQHGLVVVDPDSIHFGVELGAPRAVVGREG